MLIQYKPGAELSMADALSRLYVCASRGENGLSPDWPLLVIQTKDERVSPGTTNITKKTVIKNKYLFADVYGTLNRKMSDAQPFPTPPHTKEWTPFYVTTETVTVSSIMPGIVCPSKKARKARKSVSKLTELTDLKKTINQKWVTAAPVCQLKPAPLVN
ncbi:hypothetical protein DSO57_1015690 [Entomophthora muscae]|uniref:Uncharacterized protein n=1 Tax=Entomophthora muscae TaxID=34485 RepID=A0ACC2RJR0_9FUNG|nr:hypothetical protein DSO57_1015690 [Entomophthora muscae]